jgi:hypothetical protein
MIFFHFTYDGFLGFSEKYDESETGINKEHKI